jgi:PiT family inorganic phosphate transporter
MSSYTTYLILASVFGFLMAWGVGANDVANAMGTSVGSKALTIRQAIIIATIFEFLGAFLAGGQVTDTIRKGIIDPSALTISPEVYIIGMLSALLAAAIWLIVASRFGWPVSTSHTIVGAVVGFGAMRLGLDSINWDVMSNIALSWIFSPVLGGLIAFGLYLSVQKLILSKKHPLHQAKKIVPIYMFLVGWIVAALTLGPGLKHLGYVLPTWLSLSLSCVCGLLTTLVGLILLGRMKFQESNNLHFHYANVEKIFGLLMLFTACAMAFAHGSNDVANAIGPLAAIEAVARTGVLQQETGIPLWVLLLGSVGIVAGLVMYGHKVIATVGSGITELTPTRGFSATLAASITVVMASGTGLPISTTHTLVGAVLGVGIAGGINALNLRVIRTIFLSWIITLPAGAGLSIVLYTILSWAL